MSEQSKIQWTDGTVNFWSGCSKVSPGCAHCYAEVRDRRHMIERVDHWGPGAPRLKHSGAVKQCLAMNKKPWVCNLCSEAFDGYDAGLHRHGSMIPTFHRRRVFSLSLGDWLDGEVPAAWLMELLETVRRSEGLDCLLLTKRPENFSHALTRAAAEADLAGNKVLVGWIEDWLSDFAPENVWLGVSVENQAMADERIPLLLKSPARVRFLSVEPLLGNVDLQMALEGFQPTTPDLSRRPAPIDWVIVGGESGPGARGCNVEWMRSVVDQCQAASVPVFVKQLGANCRETAESIQPGLGAEDDVLEVMKRPRPPQMAGWTRLITDKNESYYRELQFKDKKGGDMAEWPADLRVREFPEVTPSGNH